MSQYGAIDSQSLRDTTALILAGGLGTRLRSVISDVPKVLAPVHGRPFLACLLDQLADAGLTHAVLCTGYRADLIEAAFGGSYRSLTLEYSRESEPLGTGGALRLAADKARSQTILAMNGDSFIDADFPAYFGAHRSSGLRASLLLTEVPDTARYGRVQVEPGGRVVRFDEKGAHRGVGWINAGVYLFRRDLFAEIPRETSLSFERDLLPAWIAKGLGGIPCRGRFLDIGTPESFAATETFFRPRGPAAAA